jgi:SPP1 family predicted phage head-tail adaptor
MVKDKKIIIYNKTEVQDDIGNWVTAYQPIHPGSLWAYARQLSQKEYFAAGTAGYKEDMQFTVNWRRDIKPGMLIYYRETWYVIDRVDTFEGYKEDLKLLAKEAAQSEIPPADEIVPYGG